MKTRAPTLADEARRLEELARRARRKLIETACRSKTAHVGSCLSCVDMLVALYFGVLRIERESWDRRDIFVLSKGHAALALYAVLNVRGALDDATLAGYFLDGGSLPAHLDRATHPWIEASAGSLGHGLPMAAGLAYARKLAGSPARVFCLVGDGESEEGSVWECALFAPRLGLDNLTVLLDVNRLQGYGRPQELCAFEPVQDKWAAFGWDVRRLDGHNMAGLLEACRLPACGKPRVLVCDTVKGKGVSFMEDELKWHYYIVTEELRDRAFGELEDPHAG
ncbi:MAG: transketolase [Lentisphaerae bacterium]|nr:transketolase [Lentisphaerota bacterium]